MDSEVYQPIVDVAVDYLANSPSGKQQLRFQCKCRSKADATVFNLTPPKDKHATLSTHVFYVRGPADRAQFWIIPFSLVKKITKRPKGKTGKTIYRLTLTHQTVRKLRDYVNEDGIKEAINWKP